jgi:CubicO group peptidase (beta-lactamase class C family)
MLTILQRVLQLRAAAVIASTVVLAQNPTPPANPKFDAVVALAEAKMREHRVPGVALGIIEGGVMRTRGLGVTNVEDQLRVTEHTVFPIASISKTFAATLAMRLVEQGKLDLKAPVRKYLPDFRVQDEEASRDVTMWHLLTHTGGWEGQISGPERGEDTLRNFVATLMPANMQVAPPAAAWSYNNAGFSTAGRVIEVLTGQSINRAMRELIFQPLGLLHAGTTAGDFIVNRFAAGHSVRGESGPILQRPFSPSASVTAGGIGICISDLLTYAAFHMGEGTAASGGRVLTRASLEQMRTAQLRKQSYDDDMGIGWHLRNVGGVRVAAHGGTLGGHILLLEIAPERNFAIAILTNANTGWRLIQDVERAALASYLGATFAVNQAISHRGLVETLPRVEVLATQPDSSPYVGRYLRPMNSVTVRAENGRLLVQVHPNTGTPDAPMPIAFYGRDRAVITEGPDRGQGIEFVRDETGAVKWIRITGRVAGR